ncbi:LytR/AlgR family response regulator transcription factor [Haliscomenobacter hydrossis]|uniref:Two component transcriptional regulator, LytTR family n=1 Tax=Haliscomenobacter hydrossis (strain ATCC 27775 / DSM 1100 / LMG 10767 / O) TaxID=760192 RepID=F4L126_HALH1|nr:LytTR family DNA-binding domain-containing protein [Haliscomenobacter hydrossis]AEE51613.1 two component transcriptional regulator, LytTR family [Haliscomenobacter hydrossis DSM 1100]
MKAIIVDDEPKAIELIQSYLAHFSAIELAGTFRNGFKAFQFISKEPVDLIFLDINMAHLSGISLSKMVDKNIKIIFTTAYPEYAVESYDVEAVDYLLKPISLERFSKTIGKLLQNKTEATENTKKTLMLKSGSKQYRTPVDDIFYLEKSGNYMEYQFQHKSILTRESISEALAVLPDHFIQIHKSIIINLNKIEYIDKEYVSINGKLLPIGSVFRTDLGKKLG